MALSGGLLVLLIIIVIIVAGLIIFAAVQGRQGTTNGRVVITPTCEQAVSTSSLLNITQLPCCCPTAPGQSSQEKYISQLDIIVAPNQAISYSTVCQGYCDTYNATNNSCISATNSQAQELYNQCVSRLEPKQCQGAAMPIAYSGSTYYYAQEVGNSTCIETYDCNNITTCSA